MPIPVHRRSVRRRVLTLIGLLSAIAVVGVQTASGARTRDEHPASGATVTSNATDPTSADALPADQPALDAAAQDAQSIAGSAYYTDAVVNDAADTVDVYLASAPQSVIDQLQAMHPGTYVVHNDAANPRGELMKIENALPLAALSVEGVDVDSVGPTSDGHLQVGVSGTNTQLAQLVLAATAQSALGSANSAGAIQVYGGAQPGTTTGYRYSESAPWNGGDFVSSVGTDRFNGQAGTVSGCSSGIEVHKTGDTSLTYMLEASHCSWIYGSSSNPGVGTQVYNGYNSSSGLQGLWATCMSCADIGAVKYRSDDSSGNTSLDAALIPTSSGYDVFKSGWNSSEIGPVTGVAENQSGDHVCISGAYTGEICGLEIQQVGVQKKLCPSGWGYCFYSDVNTAWNPNGSSFVGNMDGDSGGPVYWKDSSGNIVARGMIEGTDGTTVSCSSISIPPGVSPPANCYHVLWFQGMDNIDGGFDVTPNQN